MHTKLDLLSIVLITNARTLPFSTLYSLMASERTSHFRFFFHIYPLRFKAVKTISQLHVNVERAGADPENSSRRRGGGGVPNFNLTLNFYNKQKNLVAKRVPFFEEKFKKLKIDGKIMHYISKKWRNLLIWRFFVNYICTLTLSLKLAFGGSVAR